MGLSSTDWKKYNARKAAGICVTCGVVPPSAGLTQCKSCSEGQSERKARLRREKLAVEDLCSRCVKNKPTPGYKMCASCRILGRAAARKLAEKTKEAKYMDRAEEELRSDLADLSSKHAGKITSVRFAANLIGVCGLVLSKIPGNKVDKLAIYDELTKSVRDKLEASE